MSIFDNAETKFCKQLFRLIMETKPEPVVSVLHRENLFSQETAVSLSLFTFGFCLGALDIEFSKRYSPAVCDRLSDKLFDLYVRHLESDLFQPGASAQSKSQAFSYVMSEVNSYRSYVQYVLSNELKDDRIELISMRYLETLCISLFGLDSEAESDFNSAVKYMLDFSVLPFPYPSL